MTLGRLALAAVIVMAATGCSKYKSNLNPNVNMTIQQRLTGYWDLAGKADDPGIPTRMKITPQKDGSNQLEFCTPSQNGSMGVSFKVVNRSIKLMPSPDAGSMPFDNSKQPFSAEITKLDGNTLELNKSYTYKRINPKQELSVSSASSPLCDKQTANSQPSSNPPAGGS